MTASVKVEVHSKSRLGERPGRVVLDVDSVATGQGNIHQRVRREPGTPVKLLVTASGSMRHSNLVIRGPRARRTFRLCGHYVLNVAIGPPDSLAPR